MNAEKGICPVCGSFVLLYLDEPYSGTIIRMCLPDWREYVDALEDAVNDEEEDAKEEGK